MGGNHIDRAVGRLRSLCEQVESIRVPGDEKCAQLEKKHAGTLFQLKKEEEALQNEYTQVVEQDCPGLRKKKRLQRELKQLEARKMVMEQRSRSRSIQQADGEPATIQWPTKKSTFPLTAAMALVSYLEAYDIAHAAQVSKAWHRAFGSANVWKHHLNSADYLDEDMERFKYHAHYILRLGVTSEQSCTISLEEGDVPNDVDHCAGFLGLNRDSESRDARPTFSLRQLSSMTSYLPKLIGMESQGPQGELCSLRSTQNRDDVAFCQQMLRLHHTKLELQDNIKELHHKRRSNNHNISIKTVKQAKAQHRELTQTIEQQLRLMQQEQQEMDKEYERHVSESQLQWEKKWVNDKEERRLKTQHKEELAMLLQERDALYAELKSLKRRSVG